MILTFRKFYVIIIVQQKQLQMSDNMAYEFSKSIKKPSSPYNRVWWLSNMVRKLFGF